MEQNFLNPRKPILCIFMGYSPSITKGDSTIAGSEIMAHNLAKNLLSHYDVNVFGTSYSGYEIYDGVKYYNLDLLEDFQDKNEIEILIVSRYIYYFLEYQIRAKKTYVWMHDKTFHYSWNGGEISDMGKNLMEYVDPKIKGYITLTQTHKNLIKNIYKINQEKIHVIGNALEKEKWEISSNKIKNSFIWVSSPDRGLDLMLEYFPIINEKHPDSELYIYWNPNEITTNQMDIIKKYPYIHFGGKLNNDQIIEKFKKTDYWAYPNTVPENFSMAALEAQMSGCMCITSERGFEEVIADRGIIIDSRIHSFESGEFKTKFLDELFKVMKNPKLKKQYTDKGKLWAIDQCWDVRIKEWLSLFKK